MAILFPKLKPPVPGEHGALNKQAYKQKPKPTAYLDIEVGDMPWPEPQQIVGFGLDGVNIHQAPPAAPQAAGGWYFQGGLPEPYVPQSKEPPLETSCSRCIQ